MSESIKDKAKKWCIQNGYSTDKDVQGNGTDDVPLHEFYDNFIEIYNLCLRDTEKKIVDLEYYKQQWRSIAGSANLHGLINKNEELEDENKLLRELVKGLVECVKSYGATDMWAVNYETNISGKDVFYKTEALSDESDMGDGVVLAGKRARQCLKENAEAIERVTKEEK